MKSSISAITTHSHIMLYKSKPSIQDLCILTYIRCTDYIRIIAQVSLFVPHSLDLCRLNTPLPLHILDTTLYLYNDVHLLLSCSDSLRPPPSGDLALVKFVNLGCGTAILKRSGRPYVSFLL